MKFVVFLVLIAASMFTPSYVFDQHGYLQVARVGGALFTVLQQIILIDLAYSWNDRWVQNADEDEKEEVRQESGRRKERSDDCSSRASTRGTLNSSSSSSFRSSYASLLAAWKW